MNEILTLVNEMSPYLLLGFFIAGLMHAFSPRGGYAKYLGGRSWRSVVNSALIGVPLPLCSCGVIPTAMSLRKQGASRGAVVSFLIATPQTGVDSIFATYSLMGLPFAIIRPVAALVTAVVGGVLVNVSDGDAGVSPAGDVMGGDTGMGWRHRLADVLRFGFVEMMGDIGKWLVVGLVIAGLLTVCVPDEWFAAFEGNTLASMLLVLAISIPMYLCATGSIPIAAALMLKGITPGAAFVLLMAGPACNMASILVVNKVLGRKTLVLYLASIILGAILFGVGIDMGFGLGIDFGAGLSVVHGGTCHHTSWYQWLCSGTLVLLLLNALRLHLTHGGGGRCECHEHATEVVIKGMNCSHCRANAERAISSCQGVESVSIDLSSGRTLIYGHGIDLDEVKKSVKGLGFDIILKVLPLFMVLSLTSCSGHEHKDGHEHEHETVTGSATGDSHGDEIVLESAKAKAAGVVVETVSRGKFHGVIHTSGKVISASCDETAVVATISGRVTYRTHISEGMKVSSGATMFAITSADMQVADGDPIERARIEYERAKRDYERAQLLVKDQIVSQKDLELARSVFESAELTLRSVEKNRSAGGVVISAPKGGYVKQCLVSEGDYVEAGQMLAVITQNQHLYLRAEVPQRMFGHLGSIRCAKFRTSYSDRLYDITDMGGKVQSYGRSAEGGNAFLPVTFEFQNTGDVVPGSYAEIFMETHEREGVLSLPITALTEEQGLHYVYIQVDEDGYRKQEVTLGQSDGERIEITRGIEPGDRVVTKGAVQVRLASASAGIPAHNHNH